MHKKYEKYTDTHTYDYRIHTYIHKIAEDIHTYIHSLQFYESIYQILADCSKDPDLASLSLSYSTTYSTLWQSPGICPDFSFFFTFIL